MHHCLRVSIKLMNYCYLNCVTNFKLFYNSQSVLFHHLKIKYTESHILCILISLLTTTWIWEVGTTYDKYLCDFIMFIFRSSQ